MSLSSPQSSRESVWGLGFGVVRGLGSNVAGGGSNVGGGGSNVGGGESNVGGGGWRVEGGGFAWSRVIAAACIPSTPTTSSPMRKTPAMSADEPGIEFRD